MDTRKRAHSQQVVSTAAKTELRGQKANAQDTSRASRITVIIVFIVDVTGSMQHFIDAIVKALMAFIDYLRRSQVDSLVGLVLFRDELINEMPQCFNVGTPLEDIKAALASTVAKGGGDIPKSSLPAIMRALDLAAFRKDVQKIALLVSDAPPHDPERGLTSSAVLARLKQENVALFACTPNIEPYKTFCNRTGGMLIPIKSETSKDAFCELLLKEVAPATVKTVKRGAPGSTFDYAEAVRRTHRM